MNTLYFKKVLQHAVISYVNLNHSTDNKSSSYSAVGNGPVNFIMAFFTTSFMHRETVT